MKIVLAVLLGAAALLVAGCGSSSNNATETTVAAVDTSTEQTDTTSTDTSSSADTSTESTDTSTEARHVHREHSTGTVSDDVANAAGLSKGCKKVANLSIEFSNAIAQASASGSDQDLETTAKAFESFANQVPEEIRDAVQGDRRRVREVHPGDQGSRPEARRDAERRRHREADAGLAGARQRPGQGRERGRHEVGDRQLLQDEPLSRRLGLSAQHPAGGSARREAFSLAPGFRLPTGAHQPYFGVAPYTVRTGATTCVPLQGDDAALCPQ